MNQRRCGLATRTTTSPKRSTSSATARAGPRCTSSQTGRTSRSRARRRQLQRGRETTSLISKPVGRIRPCIRATRRSKMACLSRTPTPRYSQCSRRREVTWSRVIRRSISRRTARCGGSSTIAFASRTAALRGTRRSSGRSRATRSRRFDCRRTAKPSSSVTARTRRPSTTRSRMTGVQTSRLKPRSASG